jgi:methionine-S-sulfoxide reductase
MFTAIRRITVLSIFFLLLSSPLFTQTTEKAILAGGCFWCVESNYEKMPGIIEVVSGYSGGTGANPTYRNYAKSGHIEVVEVEYNPSKISYEEVLEAFWSQVDPTDAGGQFCDRGYYYSTAIFYLNDEQKQIAEKSKRALQNSGRLREPVKTQVLKASKFWAAEEYHQDYYKKNPVRYKYYRTACGRDNRLKQLWGDDANKAIQLTLN